MPSRDENRRTQRRLTRNNYRPLYTQIQVTGMSKRDLVRESKNIVIKPSMKLAWDDELNRMVWR